MKDLNDGYLRKIADGAQGAARARLAQAELDARAPQQELRSGDHLEWEHDDWPVHQPDAPDAPIPGRHWYSACDDGYARVDPDTGICQGCGGHGCRTCGRENCPDHEGA